VTRPNNSSQFHHPNNKSLTGEKWISFYDIQTGAVKASSSQVRVSAILSQINPVHAPTPFPKD